MTGYASESFVINTTKFLVEIKSVNSKNIDLSIRIPQVLKLYENDLRKKLTDKLHRGKIEINVSTEGKLIKEDVSINKEIIKNLSRQLEQLNVSSVLQDKTKNIIKDDKINNIKVRFQKVQDLPPKDLRKLVDNGKKELGDGIVIVFASSEGKVGLAVGITEKLVDKYDAVKFAKLGSETVGGKGGGGRKDFAQAGGQDKSKIEEAFEKIKSLI